MTCIVRFYDYIFDYALLHFYVVFCAFLHFGFEQKKEPQCPENTEVLSGADNQIRTGDLILTKDLIILYLQGLEACLTTY